NWTGPPIHTPEPVLDSASLAADRELYESIYNHTRVLLYGEGPDNALQYEWKPYLLYLMSKRRFGRLVTDICGHTIRHRRIPLVTTFPRMLKRWTERDQWRPHFPDWI